MFYETEKNDHGLPYNPFKSVTVPRAIGWISSLSKDGKANLAPYSQFTNLTFDPPYVMFAANQTGEGARKDSTVNIEETGEFVHNMVTYDLRQAMNITAEQVPPGTDEFEMANLTKESSELVKPFRVAESPVHLECVYHQTIRLPGNGDMGTVDIIMGKVVGIHINDDFITPEGKIDILKIKPIARMGYYDYTVVERIFNMSIDGDDQKIRPGLEGAPEKLMKK